MVHERRTPEEILILSPPTLMKFLVCAIGVCSANSANPPIGKWLTNAGYCFERQVTLGLLASPVAPKYSQQRIGQLAIVLFKSFWLVLHLQHSLNSVSLRQGKFGYWVNRDKDEQHNEEAAWQKGLACKKKFHLHKAFPGTQVPLADWVSPVAVRLSLPSPPTSQAEI